MADSESFSRAAESLHVAQPAVSQQIKRLEHQLGTDLFTRSTRRVELTTAGEILLPRARGILADIEQAETAVGLAAAGLAGRVRVGFVGTATYDLLPRVARAVGTHLPSIELEVYGEQLGPDIADALVAGRLDIGVTQDPVGDLVDAPAVSLHPLRQESLIAAIPSDHALADEGEVALAALRHDTFITHPSGHRSVMYDAVMAACRKAGFTPRRVVEVRETATLVTFIAAGMGVALVPETVTSLSVQGVEYRSLSDFNSRTNLVMAYRAGEGTTAVEQVANVMKQEVAAELTS